MALQEDSNNSSWIVFVQARSGRDRVLRAAAREHRGGAQLAGSRQRSPRRGTPPRARRARGHARGLPEASARLLVRHGERSRGPMHCSILEFRKKIQIRLPAVLAALLDNYDWTKFAVPGYSSAASVSGVSSVYVLSSVFQDVWGRDLLSVLLQVPLKGGDTDSECSDAENGGAQRGGSHPKESPGARTVSGSSRM